MKVLIMIFALILPLSLYADAGRDACLHAWDDEVMTLLTNSSNLDANGIPRPITLDNTWFVNYIVKHWNVCRNYLASRSTRGRVNIPGIITISIDWTQIAREVHTRLVATGRRVIFDLDNL
jgi:hypothetical protein